LVIDGHHVVYESINFGCPEEFTTAIASYNDDYLSQQFINYFKKLSKEAKPVQITETIQTRGE
jgi:hypothetical protein